jgi:protein-disulfide isomerase
VLEQVIEKYPNDVKVVFKNFPLRSHRFSMQAAIAAMAAASQGKFWEFHDLLFKNYNQLDDQKIQEIAQTVFLKESLKLHINVRLLLKVGLSECGIRKVEG